MYCSYSSSYLVNYLSIAASGWFSARYQFIAEWYLWVASNKNSIIFRQLPGCPWLNEKERFCSPSAFCRIRGLVWQCTGFSLTWLSLLPSHPSTHVQKSQDNRSHSYSKNKNKTIHIYIKLQQQQQKNSNQIKTKQENQALFYESQDKSKNVLWTGESIKKKKRSTLWAKSCSHYRFSFTYPNPLRAWEISEVQHCSLCRFKCDINHKNLIIICTITPFWKKMSCNSQIPRYVLAFSQAKFHRSQRNLSQ